MKYIDVIKSSPNKGKVSMWSSVERISDFLSEMEKSCPDKVRWFIREEYEALNGRHLNEWLARNIVSGMHHKDRSGNVVTGEAVTFDRSQALLEGMSDECREKCRWDAYVGANAFAHDLAATGWNADEIMKAASEFWFHDDDMESDGKVYWYFVR